jgi:transposase-like protein
VVLEEGKAPIEVAENLGIAVSLLYKWIRKHKGVDSKGKTNDFQEENKQLKHENQELKKQLATSEMYREILKKAAAYYFAAQTL